MPLYSSLGYNIDQDIDINFDLFKNKIMII